MRITLQDGKELADLIRQATFIQHVDVPTTTWTIPHGLGKYPAIACVDTSGNIVYGDINYNSLNQLTITFIVAVSGKAFLN